LTVIGNDNWGWTDQETGIEYVLSGLNDGTGFVSIEDPVNPIYLGKLLLQLVIVIGEILKYITTMLLL